MILFMTGMFLINFVAYDLVSVLVGKHPSTSMTKGRVLSHVAYTHTPKGLTLPHLLVDDDR